MRLLYLIEWVMKNVQECLIVSEILQGVYGQAEMLEGEQVKRTAALRIDDSVANNLVEMMQSRNDPGWLF